MRKNKLLVFGLILVLLFSIILFSGCLGGKKEKGTSTMKISGNSKKETTTTVSKEKTIMTKETTTTTLQKTKEYIMGEEVLVDDIAYTVTDVKTTDKIGQYLMDTFMGVKADGTFYVVSLKVENKGKESQTIFTPRFKIVDEQGRKFDSSTEAEMYTDMYYDEGSISFGKQLQPGLPIKGVKIFDLPESAKGLKLEIKGNWLSLEEVVVDLGR